MLRRAARMLPLAALTVLGACVATPRPGAVQRQWNQMMRELGINPVFPPREDVQVGDVYLRRGAPGDPRHAVNGFVPIDLWVASLQPETVEDHYRRRTSFPDSLADRILGDDGRTPPGRFIRVPRDPDATVFSRRDMSRLRQVAFPDFMSMTVTSGDVRGLVPIQAISLAFGASWSNDQRADIKIPAAESYGIPFTQIRPSLFGSGRSCTIKEQHDCVQKQCARQLSESIATLDDLALMRTRLATMRGLAPAQAPEHLYLEVITEVYYARVIDVAISYKYDFGARLRVSPQHLEVRSETRIDRTSIASNPQTQGTELVTESTVQRATELREPDPIARAQQLNEQLKEIDAMGGVGGTFQFISVSGTSVGMRRSYERPVAVGWRGITLKVRASNGAVEELGAADSADHPALPQPTPDAELKVQRRVEADLTARAGELNLSGDVSVFVDLPTDRDDMLRIRISPPRTGEGGYGVHAELAEFVAQIGQLEDDSMFVESLWQALLAARPAAGASSKERANFDRALYALCRRRLEIGLEKPVSPVQAPVGGSP